MKLFPSGGIIKDSFENLKTSIETFSGLQINPNFKIDIKINEMRNNIMKLNSNSS